MSEEAVFWDCNDSETLRLESPEEAIEEFFDESFREEGEILEQIKKWCPLQVKGYAREEIDEKAIGHLATRAVENFIESIEEDYGDSHGRTQVVTAEKETALNAALRTAFSQALAGATVWQCKVVETKTFSAEEVEKILREDRPDWFEEPEPRVLTRIGPELL